MYSVVIADDRSYELERLESLVNWQSLGMQLVGFAKNGRDALNICLSERPDILITDIKMPLMNGIELARTLSEKLPQCKLIFLSGYDDFSYTKSAIEYNVCAYILKPYTESDISEALLRASAQLDENQRRSRREEHMSELFSENLPTLRESFIHDVINSSSDNLTEETFWDRCSLLGIYFETDLFAMLRLDFPFPLTARGRRAEAEKTAGICVSAFCKNYLLFFENNSAYVLIDLDESLSSQELAAMLDSLSSALVSAFSKNGTGVSCTVSSQGFGYISWNRLYNELTCSVSSSADGTDALYKKYKENEKEIFDALENYQAEYTHRFIDELMDEAVRLSLKPSHITRLCLSCYSEAVKRIGNKKPLLENEIASLVEIDNIEETRNWLHNVIHIIENALATLSTEKYREIVSHVIDLVNKRYSEPITVTSISAELYISPNYLRHLFKKSQGKSLSSYLTDYRIDRACELLRSTGYKIADIPALVGMENNSNFYLLIKKKTGVTPSEYRSIWAHTKQPSGQAETNTVK